MLDRLGKAKITVVGEMFGLTGHQTLASYSYHCDENAGLAGFRIPATLGNVEQGKYQGFWRTTGRNHTLMVAKADFHGCCKRRLWGMASISRARNSDRACSSCMAGADEHVHVLLVPEKS